MATGGNFLMRKLEQLLPGVLEKRYRMLPYEDGSVVPTISDLAAGAPEVVRELFAQVGDAEVIGDSDQAIPVIDMSASEDRYKTLCIAASFSYTFQQMRAYEQGQRLNEINDRKMRTTRRVIAEKTNRIIAYGHTGLNITGFINNAQVTTTNESVDLYAATADVLASYFIEAIGAIAKASNGVEYPNRVEVSHDLDFHLQSKRMPDGNMNVKQYILQNSSYISEINGRLELGFDKLEANGVLASGTNKDRIVFYPFDPEVVERHNEITMLLPEDWWQVKDGRKIIPMMAATTQTIVNFPGAMRYINHAKKA